MCHHPRALRSDFSLTDDRPDDQTVVVVVHGELDVSGAPTLERRLREWVGDGTRRVVVDLSDASFLDSSGISALVNAQRASVNAGKRFAVQCANRYLLRVFDMTGIARRIAIRPTRDAALAAAGLPDEGDPGGGTP